MDINEVHLDVFENRSVLFFGGKTQVYNEGAQSNEAKNRYAQITDTLAHGFLDRALDNVVQNGFHDSLSDKEKSILDSFANGITSNYGRGLIAVGIQQMAIKAICPEQSVRLHKGSNQNNSFSWREGVSMRSIDSQYVTPFLRSRGLLKLNADGAMMTRTLAENYPYSALYKAKIQGPRKEWMELVDALEANDINPLLSLEYVLSILQNRSDDFATACAVSDSVLTSCHGVTLEKAERAVKAFLKTTDYPARAFEISMHAFMQALIDLGYATEHLEPLSQMRSANKKHGNVGDIEMIEGDDILESWDAKYKKPYLIDELGELEDKLATAPRVITAGFVTDSQPDMTNDVKRKISDIESEFDTEIEILSLHDWTAYQIDLNHVEDSNKLGLAWITALEESLTLKRPQTAPIDEPCDKWVRDWTTVLKRSFK